VGGETLGLGGSFIFGGGFFGGGYYFFWGVVVHFTGYDGRRSNKKVGGAEGECLFGGGVLFFLFLLFLIFRVVFLGCFLGRMFFVGGFLGPKGKKTTTGNQGGVGKTFRRQRGKIRWLGASGKRGGRFGWTSIFC